MLPKYVKLISRGMFMCIHMCKCRSFQVELNMENLPVTPLVPESAFSLLVYLNFVLIVNM